MPGQWQRRQAVIDSICLQAVADEVNAKRLERLRAKLAHATASDRRKQARLWRLFAAGELNQLPSDLRASPLRMQAYLQAIHRLLGHHTQKQLAIPDIAREAQQKPTNGYRAIDDLEDAYLIIVHRKRQPLAQGGGIAASAYQLVWSTLRDLAITQGLQFGLFDDSADEGSAHSDSGGTGAVQIPCTLDDGASSHQAGAASHHQGSALPQSAERPPTTGESVLPFRPDRPPTIPMGGRVGGPVGGRSNRKWEDGWEGHARADFSSYENPKDSLEDLSIPPSPPLSRRGGVEGRGDFPDSKTRAAVAAVERLLDGLGLATSHTTANAFVRGGWSVEQVEQLIGSFQRQAIDGVRPWGLGAIWHQAHTAEPGAPITIPPSEAWLRAKRNREFAIAATSQQRQFAEQTAAAERSRSDAAALEELHGPEVDRLEVDAAAGLLSIDRGSPNFNLLKHFSGSSPRWGAFRLPLLRVIAEQAAAVGREEQP